jgi:hypothetical protein
MEIISGGHDIGWDCEILESIFVFMRQCFFFERAWEVRSRQYLSVAFQLGREPLLGKTSLEP